jgi:hypothetical protein
MSQSKTSAIQKSTNGYDNDKNKVDTTRPKTGVPTILAAIALLIISVVTIPSPFQPVGKPTLLHVWYYGWITALSTGLGVLPLVFAPELDSYWVGVSNGEFRTVLHAPALSPTSPLLTFMPVLQPLLPV